MSDGIKLDKDQVAGGETVDTIELSNGRQLGVSALATCAAGVRTLFDLATLATEATLEAVRALLEAPALPADAATATSQALELIKLEAIRALLAGTLPVDVTASVLPAGASTATLQSTGNTSLASILSGGPVSGWTLFNNNGAAINGVGVVVKVGAGVMGGAQGVNGAGGSYVLQAHNSASVAGCSNATLMHVSAAVSLGSLGAITTVPPGGTKFTAGFTLLWSTAPTTASPSATSNGRVYAQYT